MSGARLYEIDPAGRWIRCFRCGLTSHNPNDVAERFCGHCHVFHDDPALGAPGNRLKIDQVWVFIATEEEGEGVPAFSIPGRGTFPLIAADGARVDSLRGIAKDLARQTGRKITLAKFSVREDLEVIEP